MAPRRGQKTMRRAKRMLTKGERRIGKRRDKSQRKASRKSSRRSKSPRRSKSKKMDTWNVPTDQYSDVPMPKKGKQTWNVPTDQYSDVPMPKKGKQTWNVPTDQYSDVPAPKKPKSKKKGKVPPALQEWNEHLNQVFKEMKAKDSSVTRKEAMKVASKSYNRSK